MPSGLVEKLTVLIDADVKGAVREVDKLGTSADKSLKKANSGLDTFANNSIKAGTAMVGASVAIGFGLAKTVGAAQEAQQAQLKLANSVQNSKSVTQSSIGAFNQQAKALQQVTAASDEEVNSAQAMLVQFGASRSEVLKLTPLIVDLARKMGIDTVTAAKAVGKTLDGNSGALKRMGVSVDATAFANDKFGATFSALKTAAGGFAEREGKTFAGQLAIIKNQANELEESIGRGVIGVLKEILPAATSAAHGLGSIDEATGGAIGKFATIGTAALAASGTLAVLAGGVFKLGQSFQTGGALAGGFGTAVKGIAAAGGIAAAVAGLVQLAKGLENHKTAAERAAVQSKTSTDKLTANYVEFAKRTKDSVALAGAALKEFRSTAENNLGTAQRLFDALSKNPEKLRGTGVALKDLKNILDQQAQAQRQAAADQQRGTATVDTNTRSYNENKAAIEKSNEALGARRDAVIASFSSEIGAAQAVQALSKTLLESKDPLEINAQLLSTVGATAQSMSDKLAAGGADVTSAAAKQDIFRAALLDVERQFPGLKAQIDTYLVRLAAIPPAVTTVVYADVSPARHDLDTIIEKKKKAGEPVVIPVSGGGPLTKFQALGGPVNAHQPYIVGEKGPELFVPGSSGKIISNADSMARLRPAGGGNGGTAAPVYNITFAGVVGNPAEAGRQVVKIIQAHERSNGTAWRQ